MAALNIERPEPGVYAGVSFEEYTKIRAVNHSTLRAAAASMAHFRAAELEGSGGDTTATRFGTAVHTLMLEPSRFARSVVPAPINPKTNKAYGGDTKAWEEYAAQHPGKLIMSDEDLERAKKMVTSVQNHAQAGKLLHAEKGMSEAVMIWKEGPLLCKGRVDKITPEYRVDLKTTSGLAKWDVWRKSVVDYGYFTQEAMYARGAKALGLPPYGVFVVVESESPHATATFSIHQDWVAAGDKMVVEWLNKVVQARTTDQYPAYPDQDIEVLPPPQWFISMYMDGQ